MTVISFRRGVVCTATAVLASAGITACGSGVDTAAAGASATPSVNVSSTVDASLQAKFAPLVQTTGTLTLAVDPNYPPSTFKDSSGTIIGLGPDLATAIASQAGLKIKYVEVPFDGMLSGLQAHRFDASWAGWAITADREQVINLVSDAKAGTSVLVKKGNPDGIKATADMCGKTVAVQTGTTQAQQVMDDIQKTCTDAGRPKVTKLQLPQQTDVNQAVSTGRAQAELADNSFVAYQAELQPDLFEAVGSILIQPVIGGVAIPKDKTELADAIAAGFNAIIADGTYAKILSKWNLSNTAITESAVNPAAS